MIIVVPGGVVHIAPPELPRTVIALPSPRTVVAPVAGPVGATGPQGPTGPPGSTTAVILTRPAATVLSGHRVVTPLADGTVGYADNTTPAHLHAPLWLTTTAAAAGAPVAVIAYGPLTEPSWSWSPGPIYLGPGGLLTQGPPIYPAFLAQLGYAISVTEIIVDRSPSIVLT